MKNDFGKLKMTWPSVIVFAVMAGLYTAFVMLLPALKNTSFQDIGITYEWWIVFAVIIVCGCRKNTEAMFKCFVFFLISQPLIYAVEILFGKMTFDKGIHYYLTIWLPMTLLTIPGGFIAFYCKKQTLFGSIVLALGNTMEVILGISYSIMAVNDFPHHVLSAVFCFASVFAMSFIIQKKNKYRAVSAVFPFIIAGVIIIALKLSGRYIVSGIF